MTRAHTAGRPITGLKPRVESLWASGKSIQQIAAILGVETRPVRDFVALITRYKSPPINAFNDDPAHLTKVLEVRPNGFPAAFIPAAYRVRA